MTAKVEKFYIRSYTFLTKLYIIAIDNKKKLQDIALKTDVSCKPSKFVYYLLFIC